MAPAAGLGQAPDQAALILNSARKAYNEKHYTFAAARFREFLAKFGNHAQAPAARYGLALALVEGPARDYAGALPELQTLAGNAQFPDHPHVFYYLGVAKRGLALKELAGPNPQPGNITPRFTEAAQHFEAAAREFAAKAPKPDPAAKKLAAAVEWAARARCDQAEMLLRLVKPKEARDVARPFSQDPLLSKSRYRKLGLYYQGQACYLLKEYRAARKALAELAPFAAPVYGTHARYLLGRSLHQLGRREQAAEQYTQVLADFAREKQEAELALRDPDKLKNDPEAKARLEALTRGAPPDYVTRAAFFAGVLLYEKGRFEQARDHFADFARQYPASKLLPDAQLRQGFCEVRLERFADAVKSFQPVADKEARLADQALLWTGKAQTAAADPKNPAAFGQALSTASDTLRRAAERAQQLAGADPKARTRRGHILIELARTQQRAHQDREAASIFATIVNEKIFPEREPELLLRQAAALSRAGDFAGSDQLCNRVRQAHPNSQLLPGVLLCYAGNAGGQLATAAANPNLPNRPQTLAQLAAVAAKRYQEVLDNFPKSREAGRARYGLGLALYHKGDYRGARRTLEAIAPADRRGEPAQVSYLLADCILQTAELATKDGAPKELVDRLQSAAGLLEGFVNSSPGALQTPDALLKLGLCHQRLAELLPRQQDRIEALAGARSAYEKLLLQFPQHALRPQAVFERARCLARAGSRQAAVNELRRFAADPLKAAPVAPLALLQLAVLLRGQNKPDEAAKLLADCRQAHEPALLQDPQRKPWAALLQYHQADALRDAGQFAAAQAVFDNLIRTFPDHPEIAEAALSRGQCLQEDALAKIRSGQATLARHGVPPPEAAAAAQLRDEGYRNLQPAVQYLADQANQLKARKAVPEVRARMLYEAARGYRVLAEPEIAAARALAQQALLQKMQAEAAQKSPGGPPSVLHPPDVLTADLKVQPSEEKARALYRAAFDEFPDLPLAGEARLELAGLYAGRREFKAAVKLLEEGLAKAPAGELVDRLRVRLGTCLAGDHRLEAALSEFDRVARNGRSRRAGAAHYQAGEALLAVGEYKRAAARLAVFRDRKTLQNLPGVSDRALLRLGHAYEQVKDWDRSRRAYERVVERFRQSRWRSEARYGVAYAWQKQKAYGKAVRHYARLAGADDTEIGGKAQFQIGQCRLAQKRYGEAVAAFLLVPYTYDNPEWSAAALCEAARALAADGRPRQAERLLRRVGKDFAPTPWADVAKERLHRLKGD
jgi:TolA-binding protein